MTQSRDDSAADFFPMFLPLLNGYQDAVREMDLCNCLLRRAGCPSFLTLITYHESNSEAHINNRMSKIPSVLARGRWL